jgi:hypothetical protein
MLNGHYNNPEKKEAPLFRGASGYHYEKITCYFSVGLFITHSL